MRPAFASLFLFSLGLAARGEAPPALAAPFPTAQSHPPPPAVRPRVASPELAARLREGLPKYSPLKPGTAPSTTAAGDAPANDILRLPHYEVREQKVPDFREREMLTPQGRIDVALKRHPGLNFGPLKSWNHRRGLEMLEEEQALERAKELGDLFNFMRDAERLRPPATPASPAKK